MLLAAPPRLNVRAWFALAAAGPAAMLAVAAAVTHEGVEHDAGLWAAGLLAPAVALALYTLGARRQREGPPPTDQVLTAAFALTVSEAAAVLLSVLMGAPLPGQAVASALAVSAIPLTGAVAVYLLKAALPNFSLEPTGLAQALQQPDAGGGQGPVEWAEYVRLEEVAGEVEAGGDVAGAEATLGGEQEGREREQPVLVGFARLATDGAPGPGADVGEVVDGAGGGALGKVEAEAEVLQETRLEADEDGGPDLRVQESGAQGFEGEEGPRMWLPLRKRPGRDGGGGGHAGQRQWIIEERCGPLTLGLEGRRAELFGDAGSVADEAARTGLHVGPHAPGGAAGDMGGPAAVLGGQQVDDRAALAVGAGREDEGVVGEFHRLKLWAPETEIQPRDVADYEEALGELKDLLAIYRSQVARETTRRAAA
jgi:hypothetical protein